MIVQAKAMIGMLVGPIILLSGFTASAHTVKSVSFQVKSACLRTLSESEVANLSAQEMRLYIKICSRIPNAIANIAPSQTPVAFDPIYPKPAASLAEQRTALAAQLNQVRLDIALVTIALNENDAKNTADQQAEQAALEAAAATESKQECRNLTTVESAFTGGLALGPAPYGRTYIGIASLVAPLFFKNCDNPPTVTPPKNNEIQAQGVSPQLHAQFDSLTSQLNALTTQYNQLLTTK